MTVTNDYLVVENVCDRVRALVSAGVRVFDAVPTIANEEEFDQLLTLTIEQAKVAYFWVVSLEQIDPSQFATAAQRERLTVNLYGYMIRSDHPGVPDSDDPRIAAPYVQGTATGGSALTLIDSGESFGAYADTHELWVTFANGTRDHRRIASTTATQITVRSAFAQAVAAGDTYQIYLRPTEWLMHDQARLLLNALTQQRSLGGRMVTGNTPGYQLTPVTLYERGFWRVLIPLTSDNVISKSYQ